MTTDQFLWVLARVSGLGAYAALSLSLLSGLGLRSGLLGDLSTNRVLRATHEFTAILWSPLGRLHLFALVLDATARVARRGPVVPFASGPRAGGPPPLDVWPARFALSSHSP